MTNSMQGQRKSKKDIEEAIKNIISKDRIMQRQIEGYMFTGKIDENTIKKFFEQLSKMFYAEDLYLIRDILNSNPNTKIFAQKIDYYKSFFKEKPAQVIKGGEREINKQSQKLQTIRQIGEGKISQGPEMLERKQNIKQNITVDELFKVLQKIRHKIRGANSYSDIKSLISEYDRNLALLKELFIKEKVDNNKQLAFYKDQGIKFLLELNNIMEKIKKEKHNEWLKEAFLYIFDYLYADQFLISLAGDASCLNTKFNLEGRQKSVFDIFLITALYYTKLSILNKERIANIEDVLKKFSVALKATDERKHNTYVNAIERLLKLIETEYINDNELRYNINRLKNAL